jgi:hypothetical protein
MPLFGVKQRIGWILFNEHAENHIQVIRALAQKRQGICIIFIY